MTRTSVHPSVLLCVPSHFHELRLIAVRKKAKIQLHLEHLWSMGRIKSELWFPWQQIAPIGLYCRKSCDQSSAFNFNSIFLIFAGNENNCKISDEYKIRLNINIFIIVGQIRDAHTAKMNWKLQDISYWNALNTSSQELN